MQFVRSDELPRAAPLWATSSTGVENERLPPPVRGRGDGGIYSTVADIQSLWTAFFAGRIEDVSEEADVAAGRPLSRADGCPHALVALPYRPSSLCPPARYL
jgi:hypothetical protein